MMHSKPHVVILKSRSNIKGGLEKYTRFLSQAFIEKGCRTTLLTTGSPPHIEGAQCHSLAPDSKLTLYHLCRFDRLCQKWLAHHSYDVVFGMERTTRQTHYRAGNGVHAVYLQRRKLIEPFWKRASLTLNPLHRQILSMEKKAFESEDLKVLFTNSNMVKEEILRSYSTPPTKIEVIHNGVEWQKWRACFEGTFSRKKNGPYHLLFIGNGYHRKGLLFLMQALKALRKEDVILTVIGRDKNPTYFSDWAEKNELKKKIYFLGPQSDVLPFYQEADALVIPSIYDPFANVTLEALAMGLFVISSPYNGGKEVLQPENGVIIKDLFSVESLVMALKVAFDHPKTQINAFAIRESVKTLDFSYQLDKIVHKTLLI